MFQIHQVKYGSINAKTGYVPFVLQGSHQGSHATNFWVVMYDFQSAGCIYFWCEMQYVCNYTKLSKVLYCIMSRPSEECKFP